MPFVVASCTKTYTNDTDTEPCSHVDEDLSVPIESEETAVQFALEAIKMTELLFELAGEEHITFPHPNGALVVVGTAHRQVAFGIKSF